MAKRKETSTKGKGTGARVSPRSETLIAMDNSQVKSAIKSHIAFKRAKEAERKVINQAITSSRNALVARGLNRQAITMAEKFAGFEAQHQDGFDVTFMIARKATGLPIQAELFAAGPKTQQDDGPGSGNADDPQKPGAIADDQVPENLSEDEVRALCADNHIPYDDGDPGGSYARMKAELARRSATPDDLDRGEDAGAVH